MNSAGHSSVLQAGQVLYLDAPISLLPDKVFIGCNSFHTATVFCQSVDFGALSDVYSEIAGADFAQAFIDRFTGLKSFVQQNGINDEFIANMRTAQGVDFQEILLEAILAVETSIAFARHDLNAVSYAAIQRHENSSDLIWGCSSPKLSRGAAKVGLLGLIELLPVTYHGHQTNDTQGFDAAFNELWQLAKRRRLAPSTSIVKMAAKKRGIPCKTLGRQHLLLGYGKLQQQIYASMSGTTSSTAQKICSDKRQTNRRLTELRLPVARQIKVGTLEAAYIAAEKIGFPLVIKPVKGKKGKGITAGLTSAEGIKDAFERAHKSGSDVLVERFIAGDDFRLLVIGGRFVAAVNRQPPCITGDGKSTVATLLDRLNEQPYRDGFRGFPVEKDAEFYRLLEQAGLTMSDVPDAGQTVILRSAATGACGQSRNSGTCSHWCRTGYRRDRLSDDRYQPLLPRGWWCNRGSQCQAWSGYSCLANGRGIARCRRGTAEAVFPDCRGWSNTRSGCFRRPGYGFYGPNAGHDFTWRWPHCRTDIECAGICQRCFSRTDTEAASTSTADSTARPQD
jgi:cyanophycin synthetase